LMLMFKIRAHGCNSTKLIYMDKFYFPVLKKTFQIFINQFTLDDTY
jgi:hypothetical protein